MKKNKVLETQINEITLDSLSKLLLSESNLTVAVCNANSLVRAYKNEKIKNILNNFDICTPDGFPEVILKVKYAKSPSNNKLTTA